MVTRREVDVVVYWLMVLGCGGTPSGDGGADSAAAHADDGHDDDGHDDGHDDGGHGHDSGDAGHHGAELVVTVTLDGDPVEGALLVQPGTAQSWTSDAAGQADVSLDVDVNGTLAVLASHPDARIGGVEYFSAEGVPESATISLVRFSTVDNADYTFQPPGTPQINETTIYCSHCHITINDDWYVSPHAGAASNPVVQDMFAGTAAALSSASSCADAGGEWWTGHGRVRGALLHRRWGLAGAERGLWRHRPV